MNLITINTDGLEESIRCILCKNNMKTNIGCDGSCVVDNSILAKICDEISSRSEEKYRWHNMEKNPQDIPDDWLKVLTIDTGNQISLGGEIVEITLHSGRKRFIHASFEDFIKSKPFDDCTHIIAWKEIEPFEEED